MAEQKKSNLWLIIGVVVVVLATIYWFASSGEAPDQAATTDAPATTSAPADSSTQSDPTAGAVSVEPAAPADGTQTDSAPAGTAPAAPAN